VGEGWKWNVDTKLLTAPKYHASTPNRMVSTMNIRRTSLKVNPSSLVPAVSLVTPLGTRSTDFVVSYQLGETHGAHPHGDLNGNFTKLMR